VLHTHLSKKFVTAKANLDNYDGLTDSREHIQNVRSTSELVTIKSDVMCKVFLITFHEFVTV
jgi:hypothetical protein